MTDKPNPIIIAVAPNGARRQKIDHPALPITPTELAETALDCHNAGASMIHLHVRDARGVHSLNVEAYRAAISTVRQAVGHEMIIQVTSEAMGIYTVDQQMQMVKNLKPEAVSLAIREVCAFAEGEIKAAEFFAWLRRESISPQFILYSVQDVLRFNSLRQRGVIPGDLVSVLYVLGRDSETGVSSAAALLSMLNAAKTHVVWMVCAFGATEAKCMLAAAEHGGHARVGFENNIQLPNGEIAVDNAALVVKVADGISSMGRQPASSSEARLLLGMA